MTGEGSVRKAGGTPSGCGCRVCGTLALSFILGAAASGAEGAVAGTAPASGAAAGEEAGALPVSLSLERRRRRDSGSPAGSEAAGRGEGAGLAAGAACGMVEVGALVGRSAVGGGVAARSLKAMGAAAASFSSAVSTGGGTGAGALGCTASGSFFSRGFRRSCGCCGASLIDLIRNEMRICSKQKRRKSEQCVPSRGTSPRSFLHVRPFKGVT